MRTIAVLAKKELFSLFTLPATYILIFAFLLLNGYTFWILLSALNDPNVHVESSVMQLFFGGTLFFWFSVLLIVSVVTMRLFSEEKKNGTLELLLTAPVRNAEVVLGKFLGAFLFYVLLWIPTLVYPMLIERVASLDWGPVLTGYSGVLLLGFLLNSIGIFASSVTENQVIAAVISFFIAVLLFSFSFFEFFIPVPEWQKAFAYVNMLAHFDDMGKGIIDSRIWAYYGSLSLFFLVLTVKTAGSRK